MKRLVCMIFAAVLLLTSLAACGAKPDEQGTATSQQSAAGSTGEPVKLTFWKGGSDPAVRDYFLSAIERYSKSNANVTIEYTDYPLGSEWDTKLNTAFASGVTPDIIGFNIGSLASRATAGQYAELDGYLNGWDGKSDISEELWERVRYDGKIYSIPYSVGATMLAYRKDYFKEAGLDPEKPPETWEQLAEYAKKLTKYDGNMVSRAGLVIPIDNYDVIGGFLKQNDARIVAEDGKSPAFNNPEFIETVQYMTSLFKDQKVTFEVTKDKEREQPSITTGRAAMQYIYQPLLATYLKENPENVDNIGFAYPVKKQKGIWGGADMLMISNESKLKDEAWKFIEFTMTTEEMKSKYEIANITVLRNSMKDYFIEKSPTLNTAIWEAVTAGADAPKVTWAGLYMNTVLPKIQQEAFYNKKTPEQTVQDNYDWLVKEIQNMK